MLIDANSCIQSLELLASRLENAIESSLNEAQSAALSQLRRTQRFKDQSGTLRASFKGYTPQRFTRVVDTEVKYAPFVEFGTKFIRPRRFMAMAGTYGEIALLNALETNLSTVINGS